MKAVPELIVGPADPSESGQLHFGRIDDVARTFQRDELDDALAVARKQPGFTLIALPAPVVAAPAIVSAFRSAPVVAWSSRSLTLVGIGSARELRGTGDVRCQEVIAAARRIEASTVIDRSDAHELVRPRLLGGLAFAPGAADATPWTGFGDAGFVLPRWTYVHDGVRAALVLAIDARDAAQATRWRDELAAFRAALATTFAPRPQPPLIAIDHGNRSVYREQVAAITDAIVRGECA